MRSEMKSKGRAAAAEPFEKVELSKTLEAVAFVQVCLGCAYDSLKSGEVEDNPEPRMDLEGLVDDLDHALAKLNREIRKLDRNTRLALDVEVDRTYDLVHRNSPTR